VTVDADPGRWTRAADGPRLVAAAAIVSVLVALAYWLHAADGRGPAAAISLLCGAALGVLMQRGRFCFYCIFRDAAEDRDTSGLYSILAALATGAVGYAVIFGAFLPDPGAGRLPPAAHIGPVSWVLVVGGFAFGVGMALSGACISGHLYRIGEGYLRALPALAGTLVGFGLGFASWNQLYLRVIRTSPVAWLPSATGYGGALLIHLAVLGLAALALLRWYRAPPSAGHTGAERDLRWLHRRVLVDRWPGLLTGAGVGIVGAVAYLRVEPLGVTAQMASFARTEFTERGVLDERLEGLDVMRGCVAVITQTITDNGWLILGLVAASFAAALAGGRTRLQVPTARSGAAALVGGVLMGWSAMVSLGCTVGVLLSGTQAFAVSGVVFGVAVFAGVWVAVKARLHRI
jgi:hypothetical protein